MSAPLIEIRNISVGFTGKSGAILPVLRDIDNCPCIVAPILAKGPRPLTSGGETPWYAICV